MNIEIKINFYTIKILFNEIVWVHIQREEFVGYHSWSDGNNKHSIEFITKTNSFIIEQDTKEKWIEILKALNQYL
jgi:hypothetical protein